MWQAILTTVIVVICAAYLLQRLVRAARAADKGCGCGHKSCGSEVIPSERLGRRQELIQLGAGEAPRSKSGE